MTGHSSLPSVGMRRAVAVAVALALALPVLPAAAPASAISFTDGAFLNTTIVRTLNATINGTQAYNNTTLYLPLHWGTTVLNSTVTLRAAPYLEYTNLSGWGTAARDFEGFGSAVVGGDFNADGFSDVAVAADASNVLTAEPGRVDIFFGSSSGLATAPAWSWTAANNRNAGHAMTVGDYNGDGRDDLVVGSGYSGTRPDEAMRLFYSTPSGLSTTESLVIRLSADPLNLTGFGGALAGGFDLDNDSYDDLVVGEFANMTLGGNFTGGRLIGAVHVLWGGPDGLSMVNRTRFEGIRPYYASGNDYFGYAVAMIGDTDGDGNGEFAAGAPSYYGGTTSHTGRAVVYERDAGSRNFTMIFNYTGDGPTYYAFSGIGLSLVGGHDVTGDGIPDLVVGSGYPDGDRALLFRGSGNGSYNKAEWIVGNTTGDLNWPYNTLGIGQTMTMLDINGDGQYDLAGGASHYRQDWGAAYVFRGERFNAWEAAALYPVGAPDYVRLGWTCVGVGDTDGDGDDELAVTLAYGSNGTSHPGNVRVYNGEPFLLPRDVSVAVGNTTVFADAGDIAFDAVVTNMTGAIGDYLATHRADANNTTGLVQVPLSFNFSGGGALNISQFAVNYTVVVPTAGVQVTAPPSGDALVVSWQFQSADARLFTVFSNKTGPWAPIGEVWLPYTNFTDTFVTPGQRYWYYVTETDPVAGITSAPSPPVEGTPVDLVGPARPRSVTASVDQAAHRVTVRWLANADDTVVYGVWRADGLGAPLVQVANVSVPAVSFTDAAVAEELDYTYALVALDEAGNPSLISGNATARLFDLTAPAAPTGLRALSNSSGTSIEVVWDANTDDARTYTVYLSLTNATGPFTPVETTNLTNATIAGLDRWAWHYLRMRAVDGVGHQSPDSATFAVKTVDSEAPEAPLLTGAEPVPSGRALALAWSAAGDDLASFVLYADSGSGFMPVATTGPTARAWILADLTDRVPLRLRVTAVDGGGLESTPSNEVNGTPGDSAAPAAPTGVTVEAAEDGSSLVVSWTASPDPGVVRYRVYISDLSSGAGFAAVAETDAPAVLATLDEVVAGVSYEIRVTAVDAGGNESPPSGTSTALPRDRIPPAAPAFDPLPKATNGAQLTVSGRAEPSVSVKVYANDALVATLDVDASGRFAGPITLRDGNNTIWGQTEDPRPSADPAKSVGMRTGMMVVRLDTQKPRVTRSLPASAEPAADRFAWLRVEFDEALDPASLSMWLMDGNGTVVPGHLEYLAGEAAVEFLPAEPLTPGAAYVFGVEGTDEAGNPLADSPIPFTVRAAPAGLLGGSGSPGPGAAAALGAVGAVVTVAVWRRRRAGGDGP